MTLKKTITSSLLFVALLLTPADSTSSVLHFDLSKSAPEADSEVESPSEIRLWFTQAPEDGTTSIRLVESGGTPLETGQVEQDPEDDSSFSITVPETLAPGTYAVVWRAMGADGHVVRDTFSFTVVAE